MTLHGVVATSVDGSSFDAAMQWDGLSPGAPATAGLFDLAAGGLRVVEQHPERHEYVLVATDAPGPGARRDRGRGVPGASRVAALAHERLRTERSWRRPLSGGVAMEVARAAGLPGSVAVERRRSRGRLSSSGCSWWRPSWRSCSGPPALAHRLRARATGGGAPLSRRREAIRRWPRSAAASTIWCAHAQKLEADRRAHLRGLRRIDRASDRRAASTHACAPAPRPRSDVLAWLGRERGEADRLEREWHACVVGLERIESALRVVALRALDRGGDARGAPGGDPVDAVALELELRSAAMSEVDRAVG